MYTYLTINIIAFLLPFFFSFHKKIAFYKDFLLVLPAIIFPASIFIVWDYFFHLWGVWSFNKEAILGAFWFGIPIEEVLFYFTIPFLSLYVYNLSKKLIKRDVLESVHKFISALILLFALTLFYVFSKKMYTSTAALVCAAILIGRVWITRPKSFGYFYKSFFVSLIPVTLIFIILVKVPVITYDDRFILGIRFFGVPIENILYFFNLYLMNVGIYQFLKNKFKPEVVPKEVLNEE